MLQSQTGSKARRQADKEEEKGKTSQQAECSPQGHCASSQTGPSLGRSARCPAVWNCPPGRSVGPWLHCPRRPPRRPSPHSTTGPPGLHQHKVSAAAKTPRLKHLPEVSNDTVVLATMTAVTRDSTVKDGDGNGWDHGEDGLDHACDKA